MNPRFSPYWAKSPTFADRCSVPDADAAISVSIFMASSTTIGSPSHTCAPSSASQRTKVPVIVDSRGVPPPWLSDSPESDIRGARNALCMSDSPESDKPAAKEASEASPAGKPRRTRRPSISIQLSTGSVGAARLPQTPPDNAATSTDGRNSSSIQRVYTPKSPSSATKAGCSSTALSNGTTVGMPATAISANARRARARQTSREGAAITSLASIESN